MLIRCVLHWVEVSFHETLTWTYVLVEWGAGCVSFCGHGRRSLKTTALGSWDCSGGIIFIFAGTGLARCPHISLGAAVGHPSMGRCLLPRAPGRSSPNNTWCSPAGCMGGRGGHGTDMPPLLPHLPSPLLLSPNRPWAHPPWQELSLPEKL